jgi:hypothetical protein
MFDRITAILVEKSQFINVCLDVYGTRAIQKFLEDISLLGVQSSFENQSNFDNILEAIKEPMAICQLVEHFNGSHVIQKIIKTFPNIDVIFWSLGEHIVYVSCHEHGILLLEFG